MESLKGEVGRRLRELRVAAGLSQADLGSRTQLEAKHISDIERGTRNITLETLERLLRGLDVEPHELWAVEPGKPLPADKTDLSALNAVVRTLDKTSRQHLMTLAQYFRKLTRKK